MNVSIFSNTILTHIMNDSISDDPLIIHNADEMKQIIKASENLMEDAGFDLHLNQIHYDSTSSSLLSGIFSGILSSTTLIIILMIIGGIFIYKINLWASEP